MRNLQTSRANNSRILRIENAKFLGYYFYINTNVQGDFQSCVSVLLIPVHDVTNKSLSLDLIYIVNGVCDQSLVALAFLWENLPILWGFDQRNHFFEGWSWFKFNNLGLALGISLKFYTTVAKGLKLKISNI